MAVKQQQGQQFPPGNLKDKSKQLTAKTRCFSETMGGFPAVLLADKPGVSEEIPVDFQPVFFWDRNQEC